MALGRYEFPQVAPAATLDDGERGIASLYHPQVGTLRFRSNPNEFNWSYTLNKRVDQTYGGRVIQLLGTRIDDFSFTADCGRGRWPEMNRVALFMRNIMIEQRRGIPATFEYTTRGWKFNAYIVSIPFSDAVEEVLREFTVSMKVQEDVSGVMSQNTLQAELRRLQDGVGFQRSKYNDPQYGNNTSLVPNSEEYQNALLNNVVGVTQTLTNVLLNPNFIGADALTGNNLTSTLLGAAGGQTTGGN
jgi:hypothetical protein